MTITGADSRNRHRHQSRASVLSVDDVRLPCRKDLAHSQSAPPIRLVPHVHALDQVPNLLLPISRTGTDDGHIRPGGSSGQLEGERQGEVYGSSLALAEEKRDSQRERPRTPSTESTHPRTFIPPFSPAKKVPSLKSSTKLRGTRYRSASAVIQPRRVETAVL